MLNIGNCGWEDEAGRVANSHTEWPFCGLNWLTSNIHKIEAKVNDECYDYQRSQHDKPLLSSGVKDASPLAKHRAVNKCLVKSGVER